MFLETIKACTGLMCPNQSPTPNRVQALFSHAQVRGNEPGLGTRLLCCCYSDCMAMHMASLPPGCNLHFQTCIFKLAFSVFFSNLHSKARGFILTHSEVPQTAAGAVIVNDVMHKIDRSIDAFCVLFVFKYLRSISGRQPGAAPGIKGRVTGPGLHANRARKEVRPAQPPA